MSPSIMASARKPHLERGKSLSRSYVVTGGGRGIGRAIVERLAGDSEDSRVVAVELDSASLSWTRGHAEGSRLIPIHGDASSEVVTGRAADAAQEAGTLTGWVNNAAAFRDAQVHSEGGPAVLSAISLNLEPTVMGCAVAVQRFLAEGTGGAIVNVSSHQAQRAVRGALPYATSKAAIEGLTRALAVDYGGQGIRTNAVALGSIITERYEAFLEEQGPETAGRIEREMSLLHPVGRVGTPGEVAAAVAYLLSEEASFINGAILPVDGGRSALGRDPEEI